MWGVISGVTFVLLVLEGAGYLQLQQALIHRLQWRCEFSPSLEMGVNIYNSLTTMEEYARKACSIFQHRFYHPQSQEDVSLLERVEVSGGVQITPRK